MRWPAAMTRKTVLEYLEIGEASLEREIIAGRLPSAVMIGGRQHWHKDAIDKALERIASGGQTEPDFRQRMKQRYGQAA